MRAERRDRVARIVGVSERPAADTRQRRARGLFPAINRLRQPANKPYFIRIRPGKLIRQRAVVLVDASFGGKGLIGHAMLKSLIQDVGAVG
ncbi:MAG: hypothetical protein K1X51_13260 [Rhodospirillaceae bacterium]|nr:hypothetical protein [Rhodospirillaceae bacterium]